MKIEQIESNLNKQMAMTKKLGEEVNRLKNGEQVDTTLLDQIFLNLISSQMIALNDLARLNVTQEIERVELPDFI